MTVPQTRALPATLHCVSLNVSLVLVTEEPPTHCGKIRKLVETQRKHSVTIECPSSGASARPRPWEPSKCTHTHTRVCTAHGDAGCPTSSPARPSSPRSLPAAVRVGPTLGAVGEWDSTDGLTGCLLVSPSRLQDHHCAEVHAGSRVVGRLSPSGHPCFVPGAPDLEGGWCGTVAGGHRGSVLGTGLADLRPLPESWCPSWGPGRLTSNGLRPAGPRSFVQPRPSGLQAGPSPGGVPTDPRSVWPRQPRKGRDPHPVPTHLSHR